LENIRKPQKIGKLRPDSPVGWSEIRPQLEQAKIILPMTDYDGTLTPIVERPELATISGRLRGLLKMIAEQPNIKLCIISGRSKQDIKGKVGLEMIYYGGNHGLEIEGPSFDYVNPSAKKARPLMQALFQELRVLLKRTEGVLLEDKGLSLTVHYRLVPKKKLPEVKEELEKMLVRSAGRAGISLTRGQMAFELRPANDWGKGSAMQLLIRELKLDEKNSGLVPIYIGDDLTDEDAFKVLESERRGISIAVGNLVKDTCARYRLESPSEVISFMGLLLKSAENGFR
jgi:trehalose 6-phosphate phosphatase